MSNKHYAFWCAVAGVVIGALSMQIVNRAQQNKAILHTRYVDYPKLNLVLQQLDRNYVDSIDRNKITDAAIEAALSTLDPHSVYMPPVLRQQSDESLASNFDGIGIQFNVPNDTAVVIEVIPGGPSEKAGILAGDRILKVDDKVIAGVKFPQDSMVRRMRGVSGTKVTVTIGRAGEVIPFDITRGKIPVHSVDAAFMVNDTLAYLRLGKFSRTTSAEVSDALSRLSNQGMRALIFDLRENSGGYLDQAWGVCDLFLPKDSMVVYMEGRHRSREELRATGRGKYQTLPVRLLIDAGSASSSEIVAGAMQDNHRATIIGRRSFGKGLVQEPINFTDGSGLRLTVARFYTPSGRCIQKPYADDYEFEVLKRYTGSELVVADSMKLSHGGILPDVFVPMDTTRACPFHIQCNRKATPMRFASAYFDAHREQLLAIKDYEQLVKYLDAAPLEKEFLAYARKYDGLVPKGDEWEQSKDYLMVSARALIGRYSALQDEAYYRLYLDIDDIFNVALTAQ